MTAQAGSAEGKDWVSSYCPNTNESSLHFRTDCTQWEQALLCDGTPESRAARGRRELVLRVRNWTGVGEGRVQVPWVLGGVEAPVLRGSVSQGQFLASLSSFLLLCVPPSPTGPGPASTSGILETSPTPSEVNESETSRVSGHPCPTRPVAALLQLLWPGAFGWAAGAGSWESALSGRLLCHGGADDVTFLCDTRGSLVTWKPKAEAGGGKRPGLGLASQHYWAAPLWSDWLPSDRWGGLASFGPELVGVLRKVRSGKAALALFFSCAYLLELW